MVLLIHPKSEFRPLTRISAVAFFFAARATFIKKIYITSNLFFVAVRCVSKKMGVAHRGFVIAAAVLLYLSGAQATTPGFRIAITSKGLDYRKSAVNMKVVISTAFATEELDLCC